MINATTFAAIIGTSLTAKPYTNQKTIPTTKATNIPKDISVVDLVLILLISWGNPARLVSAAAINPKISNQSIPKVYTTRLAAPPNRRR